MPEAEAIARLCELRDKGETAEDILGAIEAVMERAIRFPAPADAVDLCGTGGDGKHTLNISTAAAFVVTAAGATVVKHGNRAVSSRSGSSDVLAALGIPNDLPAAFWRTVAGQMGLAFLHAPLFHPGLARMAPIRKNIGTRTLFNLLGPLCNPAGLGRQVVGVYEPRLVPVIAEVLHRRGHVHAWVVHGTDGSDEISVSAPTLVAEVKDGRIEEFTLSPEELGLPFAPADALTGGDAAHNAQAMMRLFEGHKDAYWDSVMLNAAAGLLVSGHAATFPEAMEKSVYALHYHEALRKLVSMQALIIEFVHV